MNASANIDKQIASLPDWRGELITRLRALIHEADPDIVEEWKWETGVWTHNGMVCAVGAFKDHVKINFFKGALLKDPNKIINAGLDSKKSRSIDFAVHDEIKEAALKELIRQAVSLNAK